MVTLAEAIDRLGAFMRASVTRKFLGTPRSQLANSSAPGLSQSVESLTLVAVCNSDSSAHSRTGLAS
jgi:hypothetical protein